MNVGSNYTEPPVTGRVEVAHLPTSAISPAFSERSELKTRAEESPVGPIAIVDDDVAVRNTHHVSASLLPGELSVPLPFRPWLLGSLVLTAAFAIGSSSSNWRSPVWVSSSRPHHHFLD